MKPLLALAPLLFLAASWRVVGVHDGDTITCLTPDKVQVKIRLHGIDAPELKQPFGNWAKQALSEMVFGKDVEVHSSGKDRYGQTIGHIRADGKDVNEEMVAAGIRH